MPDFLYNVNIEWLDWWHAHPTLWLLALAAAVAASVGMCLTRPN